ncbi:chemotaxis protein CheC [Salinibacillus xinjiangensis]|uniref:CheY-P-specific phosphatase CheC n=1 Tax=Salinibacillus xinjiangensis TaxID=1229268 RepID=A0A6G1X314_9BACI|nr:chemotaxis protein CheC [Salinibacillus xinjiangensis]MRG85377.1 CheY-P-specific phosphatase CheC [Salinibacillus xinjiangensis]
MKDTFSLSPFQLDLLKEIGNIGAGNAATSLSKILNRTVNMKVPEVKVVSFDEMMDVLGGPEQEIASIFVRFEGNASGSMFFVLTPDEASVLIRKMTGNEQFNFHNPPYSNLAISAYEELGNILAGSYLSALSDFTNLNVQPTVPSCSVDMVGAILTVGLIELSQVTDHAIFIDTILTDEDHNDEEIKGHFFLLPHPESFEVIFKSFGVSHHE